MKRVGRWTWMLLTLLLLLCASVLAADEKTYIELDETVEAVLTNSDRMNFYLDIPGDGWSIGRAKKLVIFTLAVKLMIVQTLRTQTETQF